ncbi:DUF6233 domain-containing protein [Streptomyces sp. NPDC020719]|uniref:DUF6233 domain-containing protein n=1 Tax=Streptomyces sp. NPDC020719 TaxID=3154896 RepID=UPI0033EDFED9
MRNWSPSKPEGIAAIPLHQLPPVLRLLLAGTASWPPPELRTGPGAGDCFILGKRREAVSRQQAQLALAEGIDACGFCRPDRELGILD